MSDIEAGDSERCDRCGQSTKNRAPGNGVPLCKPCQEELEFWADIFTEAGEE